MYTIIDKYSAFTRLYRLSDHWAGRQLELGQGLSEKKPYEG